MCRPVDEKGSSPARTSGRVADYPPRVQQLLAAARAGTAEDLVFSVPELLDVANVRARMVYSVFSENLAPKNWEVLAAESAKELHAGAEAVIIPHGTDTLHYTSAALAFMLRDLTGPVILVGSQRSADRPSSDAAFNLLCAARLAGEDPGEGVTRLHPETGDTPRGGA